MAKADDGAVEYVLLDKAAYIAAVNAEAKRLHSLAGRWDGTIGGRSSGLFKSLSILTDYTTEINDGTE